MYLHTFRFDSFESSANSSGAYNGTPSFSEVQDISIKQHAIDEQLESSYSFCFISNVFVAGGLKILVLKCVTRFHDFVNMR